MTISCQLPILDSKPRSFDPLRGSKVVVYHPDWAYFFTPFSLRQAETIEEQPGIPTFPGHLVRPLQQMKQEQAKVVVVRHWSDRELAARVAQEAGANLALLNAKLGSVRGPDAHLSARQTAALIQKFKRERVPAIYAVDQFSPKHLEVLAKDAAVRVVTSLYADGLGQSFLAIWLVRHGLI